MIIRIRPLLDLRHRHADQTLLDYLTLVTLAPTPGTIPVATLRERWGCSQSQVSRRMISEQRTPETCLIFAAALEAMHREGVTGDDLPACIDRLKRSAAPRRVA